MAHITYTANDVLLVVFALMGSSAWMLPTLNEKFPAPHGAENPVVAGLLLTCAAGMLVGLGLTVVGLVRRPAQRPGMMT